MNGKVAKTLRRMIFGLRRNKDENPEWNDLRFRSYQRIGRTRTLVAKGGRGEYLRIKKVYKGWAKDGRKEIPILRKDG